MRNIRAKRFFAMIVCAVMLCGCTQSVTISQSESSVVESGSESSDTSEEISSESEQSGSDSEQESADSSDSEQESSDSEQESSDSEQESSDSEQESTDSSDAEETSSDSTDSEAVSSEDSSDNSSEEEDKKTLMIGFDKIDYPIIYMESGEIAGYAIDIMNHAANEMGYTCEFRAIGQNMVEKELERGSVSCVVSSSFSEYFNPEDENNVALIDNACIFTVPSDSEINSFTGLGNRFAVKKDSYSETVLKSIRLQGLVMIQSLPMTEEKLENFEGVEGVIMISKAAALHSIKTENLKYRILPEEYGGYSMGILLSEYDSEINAELKAAITKAIADGEIYNNWF